MKIGTALLLIAACVGCGGDGIDHRLAGPADGEHDDDGRSVTKSLWR
jgi:hypothetical protein